MISYSFFDSAISYFVDSKNKYCIYSVSLWLLGESKTPDLYLCPLSWRRNEKYSGYFETDLVKYSEFIRY